MLDIRLTQLNLLAHKKKFFDVTKGVRHILMNLVGRDSRLTYRFGNASRFDSLYLQQQFSRKSAREAKYLQVPSDLLPPTSPLLRESSTMPYSAYQRIHQITSRLSATTWTPQLMPVQTPRFHQKRIVDKPYTTQRRLLYAPFRQRNT